MNNGVSSSGVSFASDFPVSNPRYEVGSDSRYAGTPPTIVGAPTPVTGATPTPTPTTPAVEPEPVAEPNPVETVSGKFDDFKDNFQLMICPSL